MRLLIIYQPDSDRARAVQEFVHEFTRMHPDTEVQLMDAASVEAETIAQTYDIVDYPTSIVLAEDGTMQNIWSGPTMPLMDEVLGYLNV